MSKRTQQVGEEIQQILGEAIQTDVKDPRVGFATIVRVEVSADLAYAQVFVSVLGDEQQQRDTMEGLERAKGFLRRTVAQELRHMRSVPVLRFKLDTSLDYSVHIDTLLYNLRQEQTQPRQEPPAASNSDSSDEAK